MGWISLPVEGTGDMESRGVKWADEGWIRAVLNRSPGWGEDYNKISLVFRT